MRKRSKILLRRGKLISFVLAAACCVSLWGCGAEEQDEKAELKRADAPEYQSDLIIVGMIQTGKESDWRDANTNDYFDVFTEENGFNLIYVDGNSSQDRQIKAMRDLIVQGVDYIVLQPIVETGWDTVVGEAEEAGIPVIVADRQVSLHTTDCLTWVGSDFYAEGQKAVAWLEQYLISQGRQDEEINIVLLEGTEGASAAIGRTKGIKEGIEAHPNWTLIADENADFTQGEGQTVMGGILKTIDNRKIDVVISENDNMMFGAMKAMDIKKLSYGVNGDIITISFDALGEAFQLMIEGKLHLSVECNPLLAGDVAGIIHKVENGEPVEMQYYTQEGMFTYENAALYVNERKY